MTIRKGEDWGWSGRLPEGAPIAATDAEILSCADRSDRDPPVVGLGGGDLHRTLGATTVPSRLDSDDAHHFPVDLAHVRLDGVEHRFVSHLVAHRGWWWGPVLVVANAEFVGTWDVSRRAHPNDGLLDAVLCEGMSARDRYVAWRRLPSASHVPHPAISIRRKGSHSWTFPRPLRVRLDGTTVGRASMIEVEVEPDALVVVV
ncbi:MAG: hypothetical protein AAGA99_26885 [Actinomycetota bacterium]